MKKSAPILIGGGSLAGMACAIRLHQLGHESCVLDKSHFPRSKLCGEFLGPDALAMLHKLNLLELVQSQAFGPVEQTFFYNRQGNALKIKHAWMNRKYPYGLAISREKLDAILVSHAQHLGIFVHQGQRILSPIAFDQAEFTIISEARLDDQQPQTQHWNSRYFIDATGRSGKLSLKSTSSKTTATSVEKQKWIGIQCHVHISDQALGTALHMFLFPGGYGGIQPISTNQANVCMMVEASLGKSMHTDFGEFISTTIGQNPVAFDLLKQAQRNGSFCTTADINLAQANQNKTKNLKLIQIGDASVTVDPFTGSGMAHALESGWLAAEILHQGIQENLHYQTLHRLYQHQYRRQFQTRLTILPWFRPLLESEHAQKYIWPILPPFLPFLTSLFR